tara:strand:- start:670 stop:993 length:324 start_codon:yes stop_codon:yes gene_type:complete
MTNLEKNISRLSSHEIDGKQIEVQLTKEQEVELKIKGRGGKSVKMPIDSLFHLLEGNTSENVVVVDKGIKRALQEISSNILISTLSYDAKVEVQNVIKSLLSSKYIK